MFIELLELLRCPSDHDESRLIVAAERTESRHIMEGTLGCPVCGAEFRIENGVALFGEPLRVVVTEGSAPETAMRLAAFLDLTDARGFAILVGTWCAHADQIHRLTETPLVLVNPPVDVVADAAAIIRTQSVIPFAKGSARAVALDQFSEPLATSAIESVRDAGRVVGRSSLAVPPHVTEIARDDLLWVGEKTAAPESAPRLVNLARGGR